MWRKLLKLREVAKRFYKKEVGNGRQTSFWYDNWSEQGVLIELLGESGIIEMGISRKANIEEAVQSMRRRRRHRNEIHTSIVAELLELKEKM